MDKKYTTKTAKETQSIGQKIAKDVVKKNGFNHATVLLLRGNLGGGKTTFLQGFAKGLGVKEKVLSPTFAIMKKFKIIKSKNFNYFYHLDCYRINKPEEILELGFKEIIYDPKNIVAVEWPEKIEKYLEKNLTEIHFKFIDQDQREITFKM